LATILEQTARSLRQLVPEFGAWRLWETSPNPCDLCKSWCEYQAKPALGLQVITRKFGEYPEYRAPHMDRAQGKREHL
jgi:hypothetical protein